jgi:hypothetical protein
MVSRDDVHSLPRLPFKEIVSLRHTTRLKLRNTKRPQLSLASCALHVCCHRKPRQHPRRLTYPKMPQLPLASHAHLCVCCRGKLRQCPLRLANPNRPLLAFTSCARLHIRPPGKNWPLIWSTKYGIHTGNYFWIWNQLYNMVAYISYFVNQINGQKNSQSN